MRHPIHSYTQRISSGVKSEVPLFDGCSHLLSMRLVFARTGGTKIIYFDYHEVLPMTVYDKVVGSSIILLR